MADSEIEPGYKVEDKISGFRGIVVTVAYHITGCTRYGVRPTEHDGPSRRGEEEFFFGDQLNVLDEDADLAESEPLFASDTDVDLGDLVEDDVTGCRGVVTTLTESVFNCPRAAFQPIPDERTPTEVPDREWHDTPRLNVMESGKVQGDYEEFAREAEQGNATATGALGEGNPTGITQHQPPSPSPTDDLGRDRQ